MKILLHSNQLGYRGTEVALYDYALYNEEILGNDSVILSPKKAKGSSLEIVQRFMNRFKVVFYETPAEIENIVSACHADMLYCIKSGKNDGIIAKNVKTCIHAVFMENDYHGDVYAYVSEWLANKMSEGGKPFVPHIVDIPKVRNNYREFLGIPDGATVFGCYGGSDSFDIKFVKEAVVALAKKRRDLYFLFMNINLFYKPFFGDTLPNIIHLAGTTDVYTKSAFINTCDAMLHARQRGETFGLAVGEFSSCNKPVITYANSPEKAHIEHLGEAGIYYGNSTDLMNIVSDFRPDTTKNWDCYSARFSPENVMKQFKTVFIDS